MSFCVVRKELMKTYLFVVSAALSRMAAVARPVVARRVKFVGVVPEPNMVAVLDLRSKPKKPSSRPLYSSCQGNIKVIKRGLTYQSKNAPTTKPVHVSPCPSLLSIYFLISTFPL